MALSMKQAVPMSYGWWLQPGELITEAPVTQEYFDLYADSGWL